MPASKAATPGGKKSLFTPEQQAQLYADEKRDGYELQATPSGTAVLVPTGNRAISIEAPPEDAPGVSLPPGLSPKQPSPNAPKAKAEGEGAAPVSLPPGLGVKSPGAVTCVLD